MNDMVAVIVGGGLIGWGYTRVRDLWRNRRVYARRDAPTHGTWVAPKDWRP